MGYTSRNQDGGIPQKFCLQTTTIDEYEVKTKDIGILGALTEPCASVRHSRDIDADVFPVGEFCDGCSQEKTVTVTVIIDGETVLEWTDGQLPIPDVDDITRKLCDLFLFLSDEYRAPCKVDSHVLLRRVTNTYKCTANRASAQEEADVINDIPTFDVTNEGPPAIGLGTDLGEYWDTPRNIRNALADPTEEKLIYFINCLCTLFDDITNGQIQNSPGKIEQGFRRLSEFFDEYSQCVDLAKWMKGFQDYFNDKYNFYTGQNPILLGLELKSRLKAGFEEIGNTAKNEPGSYPDYAPAFPDRELGDSSMANVKSMVGVLGTNPDYFGPVFYTNASLEDIYKLVCKCMGDEFEPSGPVKPVLESNRCNSFTCWWFNEEQDGQAGGTGV